MIGDDGHAMRKAAKLKILLLAGTLASCVLALAGRGSFLHWLGVSAAAAWIGLPLAVTGSLLYAAGRWKRSARMQRAAAGTLSGALLFLLLLASLPAGDYLNRRDIAAAKSYAERLVPALNEFRSQNGAFPADLQYLPGGSESLPRLLTYRAVPDGQAYTFTVTNPAEMMGWYEYSSLYPQWQHTD